MKTAIGILLLFCCAPVVLAQSNEERQVVRELSASNTGPVNQSSAEGAAATNRDFFSKLIMAVESAQDGKPVTLDWNIPVGMTKKSTIQFETVLTQPDLFAAFASKLSSDDAAALKKDLSYTDDVAATVTWSNTDKGKKKAEMVNQITAVRNAVTAMHERTVNAERQASQARVAAMAAPANDQAKVASAEQQATDLAEAERVARVRLRSIASEFGVTSAASDEDLAVKTAARISARQEDRKPQYYVSGTYHYRSNHAGPKEWKLKATLELALTKEPTTSAQSALNALMTSVQTGPDQVMSLSQLQTSAEDTKRASRNSRLAFSLEAGGTPSTDIAGRGATLPVDATHTYAGRASWGANVYTPSDPTRTGRLEFSLSYDDVTGDANKNNRFVGTLTYTQKINEKTSLPIALVYANKPQYVTDVNRHLGVHFGVSFKLSDM